MSHQHGSHGNYSHTHRGDATSSKIQGQVPGAPADGDDKLYYALYTVFARTGVTNTKAQTPEAEEELNQVISALEEQGVTIRGFYDVSAMRDNADILVWAHCEVPEDLQEAIRKLRRTSVFSETKIVWSTMGVHRDAEFTRRHAPAFALGKEAQDWVCVYPFVRSYEWYYMNPEKRAEMLKNHGMKGYDFPQVLANTIATFGLNDYEWVLALEAPELVDLVDLMRHFRNTEARLHVREETPFYTGRRIPSHDIAGVLA
ncbi:hydrogen peroxide-dependent heme synthase [Rothia sp. P6271]|uniref:hydrogen peroxide-dependent heme synthase n=1 Tax=unclassified Rothia (in: high G+C Gram-positive bacteria) TaxID=2689056 RepID=UPI003ACFDE38